MGDNKERVNEALLDVRRAYRLVWLYQRRVLDLVRVISEKFEKPFYYWSPIEYYRPGTSDPTHKSSWDMLPLYYTSFIYTYKTNSQINKGDWMLEIEVSTDDGFDIKKTVDGEPSVDKFMPPELCKSTLSMWAWYSTKDRKSEWVDSLWSKRLDFPKSGEVKEYPELNLKIVGLEYDLAEFQDEDSVAERVSSFKALMRASLGVEIT